MTEHTWTAYRKTFLAGEYAACHHGRGFILTYPPAFQMSTATAWSLSTLGMQTIQAYRPHLPHPALSWIDTAKNHGGVGASSAELACIYQYLCAHELEKPSNLLDQRQWYQNHAWNGIGLMPSGIDFIAQTQSGLIWVDCEHNQCESLSWPFDDYLWVVIKTMDKLPTHQHLKETNPDLNLTDLDTLLDPIKKSLARSDLDAFIHAQQNYDLTLATLGFKTQAHTNQINYLRKLNGVKYVRGCGAMGQDTWLVLLKRNAVSGLHQALASNLPHITTYTIDLGVPHAQ